MERPLVSVIICAYNAARTIRQCLDSCLAQDRSDYEIIVVDDGSTDETPSILASYGQAITVIGLNRHGPSRARNAGIAKARGEFIAFTDSDCIVARDWLSRLLECFNRDQIVSAGGLQRSPADESAFGRDIQMFLAGAGFVSEYAGQTAGIHPASHNPTCNVMYRARVLAELKGFLPGLWPGEDVEFDYRIRKRGWSIVFTSHAIVYHYRPQDLPGFLRMMDRYGWAQGVLVRLHGFFRPIQYLPLILVAVVTAGLWKPVIVAIAVFALAAYMLVYRWRWISICLFFPALAFWLKGYMRGVSRSARFVEGGDIL